MIKEPTSFHNKPFVQILRLGTVIALCLLMLFSFVLLWCVNHTIYSGFLFNFVRGMVLLCGFLFAMFSLLLISQPGFFKSGFFSEVKRSRIKLVLSIIVFLSLIVGEFARSVGIWKIGRDAWMYLRFILGLVVMYVLLSSVLNRNHKKQGK